MGTIIRAIDTGYGNTKFTYLNQTNGVIEYGLFPSVAPLSNTTDLTGGVIAKRDTVIVTVDNSNYEVGPDAELARHTNSSRILHKQFTSTPEYRALMLGALTYIDEPIIDILVIGTPVSGLDSMAPQLKSSFKGIHQLPNGNVTEVKEVIVLAQPMGGFFNFALSNNKYHLLRNKTNLVIDPGYFTVDWVLARGIQPITQRCGTYAGGMHSLLQHIARGISFEKELEFTDVESIDKALHSGSLTIFGNTVPLSLHIQNLKPVIDEATNAIVNSVGIGSDIDNIIVCGGAAPFFTASIRERFPAHQVHTLPNAVHANVAGFQQAGEYLAQVKMEAIA